MAWGLSLASAAAEELAGRLSVALFGINTLRVAGPHLRVHPYGYYGWLFAREADRS